MKRLAVFASLVLLIGFFVPSYATGGGDTPEIILTIMSTTENSNTVKIGYSIPYPGYVEFSLFDDTDQKIWYTAKVRDRGEWSISLKREKLDSGTYKYEFNYKGKIVSGQFSVG